MKYERLTARSAKGLKLKNGKKFVELLSDKNLTLSALNHLAELEDKIESGKMIELPCDLEKHIFVICACKDIEKIYDNDYCNGTGAIECPFENQCNREDCENENGLQVFETCVGHIFFDNETFELCALAEHTNLVIEIGKNAFYAKSQAEARLKELQGEG